MPFAVRQWPVAPDPRGPLYSFKGWDWGQVVSFQWVLSSTNATGAYSFLNEGILLPSTSDDGSTTAWTSTAAPFPVTLIELVKVGTEESAGSPPFTIDWNVKIHTPSLARLAQGGEELLFPSAIRLFGPWAAVDEMGPVMEIPDGFTITPAIWNL